MILPVESGALMRIKGTEYPTYPIRDVNLKYLCKYVYPTSVGFRRCPLCLRNIRVQYVYAVCINETECIKTQGMACHHCDAFFTTSRYLFEELEYIRTPMSQYELRRDFSVYYDSKKYIKLAETPSAYKQITLCRPGEYRTYTIIKDRKYCNSKEGVIHYTDEIARIILTAYILDRPTVVIEDNEYCIVKEKNCGKSFKNKLPYISPKTMVAIRTGKNGGLFDPDEDRILVDALAFFPNKNILIPISVTYDRQSNMYVIDRHLLRRYADKYGLMLCKYGSLSRTGDRLYELKEESLLHQFGYTVNQTDNLSSAERHEILSMVMEAGIMTPHDIIRLLEFLINRNGNMIGNELAKMKWMQDLDFVYHYKIEPKGFVIGTMREL